MYHHQSQGLDPPQGSEGLLFSTSIAPHRGARPSSTPPNSPSRSRAGGAGGGSAADPGGGSGGETPLGFDFKSPPYDNFLTSKPARSILKDVVEGGGSRGRQRARDCECQTDVSVSVQHLNLLDKVKRLGVAGAAGLAGAPRATSPGPILGGPLGGLRRSGSPFGHEGMPRNRSYPAMVGASMAMKGPGPQEESEILLAASLPKQRSLK